MSQRHVRTRLGLLDAGVLCAMCAGPASADPPAATPQGAEPATRTDVVLHTRVPLPAGRNVVWCAATSLAWNALADAVGPLAGTPGELRLGPPAPPGVIEEMNRRAFPTDALDAESFVALGGFARDGVAAKIRSAVAAKFGADAPLPTFDLRPTDAVGYARLKKDLPFAYVFDVSRKRLSFLGRPARIRAFGHDGDTPVGALHTQVVVHRAAVANLETRYESPWRGVVELLPANKADRILLSSLSPRATLEETWQAVADRIATGREATICSSTDLAIPRIHLDLDRRLTEFDGAAIQGAPGLTLREFRQKLSFALTEKGASLLADVSLCTAEGEAIRFESPFLLALMRRGATRPYLLVWIGNEDLLEKDEFRALDAEALRPLAGTWTLDRAASLEAAIEREAVQADGTPAQAREAARRAIGDRFDRMGETLKVESDGRARWILTLRPMNPTGGTQTRDVAARVLSYPGGTALVVEESAGSEQPADEPGAVSLALVDGHLEVRRSERVTILRR